METAGENNTLTAKIPAGAVVTVTLNKAAVPEGMNFDQWRINDDTLMGNPDVAYNQESFHFTMPDHDVKVEVMYKDATIESDGPGILGTGALIATGVVGSAALLYQGHMLGTELYLRYLLPTGPLSRRTVRSWPCWCGTMPVSPHPPQFCPLMPPIPRRPLPGLWKTICSRPQRTTARPMWIPIP